MGQKVYADKTYKPGSDADDSCIVFVGDDETLEEVLKDEEQVKRGQCSSDPADWEPTGVEM
jgi:hypothetical protein